MKKLALVAIASFIFAHELRAVEMTVTTSASDGMGSLRQVLESASESAESVTITFAESVTTISLSEQVFVYQNLLNTGGITIDGLAGRTAGVTIDATDSNDRIFFLLNGDITLKNLTLRGGAAAGGNGANGAGGGAGLGGAIFVGNGASILGGGYTPTNLTLSDVNFTGNSAVGGTGAQHGNGGGGGGGLGGNGGSGVYLGFADPTENGGGGGGLGASANGGNGATDTASATVGENGLITGLPELLAGSGGSGYEGGYGGASAGGGGGGGLPDSSVGTGGGGGGVQGESAQAGGSGGNGGFGGGGGGGVFSGDGGFGGGGGSSFSVSDGGDGGFGGGGGTSGASYSQGQGGFGGGDAVYENSDQIGGGGGLGAGGAIFVQDGATVNLTGGSFTDNSTTGGAASSPGSNGSAIGDTLFLGGDLTVTVNGTDDYELSGLGGAGDPSVADDANDPNAQGGLVKKGSGTLTLSGANTYRGETTIVAGTLILAGSSTSQGYVVTSGASLVADSFALNVGTVMLAGDMVITEEAAGLSGSIAIGSGAALSINSPGGSNLAVTLGSNGTLSLNAPPGGVELTMLNWNNGGELELVLGANFLVTDSLLAGGGETHEFTFVGINGIQVGDICPLVAFDMSTILLDDLSWASAIERLDGTFTQYFDDSLNKEVFAFQVTAVPEPSTWALLALAGGFLLGISIRACRRQGVP